MTIAFFQAAQKARATQVRIEDALGVANDTRPIPETIGSQVIVYTDGEDSFPTACPVLRDEATGHCFPLPGQL